MRGHGGPHGTGAGGGRRGAAERVGQHHGACVLESMDLGLMMTGFDLCCVNVVLVSVSITRDKKDHGRVNLDRIGGGQTPPHARVGPSAGHHTQMQSHNEIRKSNSAIFRLLTILANKNHHPPPPS